MEKKKISSKADKYILIILAVVILGSRFLCSRIYSAEPPAGAIADKHCFVYRAQGHGAESAFHELCFKLPSDVLLSDKKPIMSMMPTSTHCFKYFQFSSLFQNTSSLEWIDTIYSILVDVRRNIVIGGLVQWMQNVGDDNLCFARYYSYIPEGKPGGDIVLTNYEGLGVDIAKYKELHEYGKCEE